MAWHDKIRRLLTNDTNHADTFNYVYQQLLDNTVANKEVIESIEENMVTQTKVEITSSMLKNGWQLDGESPILERIGNKVFLTGNISNGTGSANTVLINIPNDCRPTKAQTQTIDSTNSMATGEITRSFVSVDTDGNITLKSLCKTYIKLNVFWSI